MELTKEQVQKIDNRLKRKGIKYWDLRIEMIDHIITDIENNSTTNDFKIELEKTLRNLGWNESLRGVNTAGWKNTNDKYRKEYHTEILAFFKSFKNSFLYIIFSLLLYYTFKQLPFNLLKDISLFLLVLPIIPFFYITTKQLLKKHGRSVNLDYGIFYFSFAFFMINLPVQFIREFSPENQKLLFTILLPLFYIANYAGYKINKKAIIRVEKMKAELAL